MLELVCGGDAIRNFLRKSVCRAWDARANRFAENDHIGIEILDPRVAAWSGADRVGLIDDEQGTVPAREFA